MNIACLRGVSERIEFSLGNGLLTVYFAQGTFLFRSVGEILYCGENLRLYRIMSGSLFFWGE